MRLSTYLLALAITLASADITFGPPPSNPTFPVPDPMHPTFFPSPAMDARPTNTLTRPQDITFGPPPSNPTFPVPNPMHPTFFPPPPKNALTPRQDISQPTPFSPFPFGHPDGHVFVEKHIPISTADPAEPSALPPAHPSSIAISDFEHSTYTVLPYTSSALTGTIQPQQPSDTGDYTGHPSPLPTSGLSISSLPISSLPISSLPISSLPISSLPISSLPISSLPISSLPTSIVVDTSSPGYSQGTGNHSVSQTIVSTLAIPSTPILVTPNPGGPVSTVSTPPTYLNSTTTTNPATGLTTSTKVTKPPASSHTGSGTSASGSSTASPTPTSSLGNILEWNAVLAVAGFLGAFAFGML